jgi:hypothetical protein
MKYSVAAVLAVAATASAWSNATVSYVTEVVDVYTTVCPASSTLTFNGVTYTNTLTTSSTITVTNCPCTISKPVYTSSAVAVPTTAPVYTNATTAAPTVAPTSTKGSVGTTSAKSTPSASTVPASGAGKTLAMSGASLAGLLGLAAYLL